MSIQRISVGAGGVQGNGASGTNKAAFSEDGRYVVFESSASTLVAGDTNGVRDIFLLDRSTGQVTRVSTSGTGAQAGAQSFDGTISADGKYVFYRTFANELSGHGSTATLIRKEIATGQIDVGPTTHSGDANDILISASADGRYVLYTQPGGNGGPIARYDYLTGDTVLANTTPAGQQLGFLSTNAPAISADGRFALFYSDGAYVVGDQATYDTFVKDLATGEIIRASSVSSSPSIGGNADSHDGYISGNGKYAVFASAASNLVPGDTNGINDVYRVDLTTREVVLVSSQADGSVATGPTAGTITSSSDDGRFVVFNSRQTNLVAGDTNGFEDIFVKDVDTGRIMRVSVAADGTQGNGHSHTPSISPDGRFVTFTSDATNLVAGDTNGVSDVFLVDLAESGFWQGVEKAGGNVQVNTQSAGDQIGRAISPLGAGKFLISWHDAQNHKVAAQVVDPLGNKIGLQFDVLDSPSWSGDGQFSLSDGRVVIYSVATGIPQGRIIGLDGSAVGPASPLLTGGPDYHCDIALKGGGFAIAASVDGYVDIGVQAFDATGHKVGTQTTFSSGTFNEFVVKDLVALDNGGYALIYKQVGGGLALKAFDANGVESGQNNDVSTLKTDIRWFDDIDSATLSDGRLFVSWSQQNPVTGTYDIFGRFLSPEGGSLGDAFVINSTTAGSQYAPHVTLTSQGDIAVAWYQGEYTVSWASGSATSIRSQLLNPFGQFIGSEHVLTNSAPGSRSLHSTATIDGGVVYIWRGFDVSEEGAHARYVGPDGTPLSADTLLNTNTNGFQYAQGVASDSQGNIVTLFSDQSGADGSGLGVYVQPLSLNGSTLAPACFLAGTMIRTPTGEATVESLAIGDRVMTADGRAMPVRFIGRQTIASRFADPLTAHPVCISAGALGDGLPARDLYTSPGHAMLLDELLVIAGTLVNGTSIRRLTPPPERFIYFHVELDEHAVIFANGAETETFCDNVPREVFDNAAEHKALYPQARPIVQLDLPTVKSARQLPDTLRQRLARQASAFERTAAPKLQPEVEPKPKAAGSAA